MLRLLSIPLTLVVFLVGAIAWSGSGINRSADFVFINRGDIITLDPNQMAWMQDIRMAYGLWEGLYTNDGQTLDPIPGAAGSVDVSDDKRIYTFHIRPNARWSNGDPVIADDFVFAWKRMLDEPGEYTYLHYYIKGAEAYVDAISRNETPDYRTVGVEVVDSRTLRVTLTNPVTFFLDLVAFPPFLPLHRKSMEPFREVDRQSGKVSYRKHFTRPPHLVSNGPFMLTAWEFKRRLLMEQNPYYWDKENVRSRSIEMVVVDDPLTSLMLFESGRINWLSEVPSEAAPELLASGRPDLHSFAGFGTSFMSLNVSPTFNNGAPNPLADKRIRQALAMAIDRQQIVRNITRCGELPATTYIPPDIFKPMGWQSTPGWQFDPKRARELLAEAGYPNGGRLPGVKYLFRSPNLVSKQLAENYARQWKQNLNLDIPLEQVENKIASQMIRDKNYSISGASWTGDYNDPSTFTDKYLSTSINNDSSWINPKYDQLLQQAAQEPDQKRRLRFLEQAERILNDEVPIIPLYHLNNQYLFRDNVKGINTNPRNMIMFKGVYVQRRD